MSIGGRDWKAMWLGLLEASLLVTALFSFATSFDEWHRLLELFSHFRLQYLVIAALLTCAFLFLRWPGYIVLGLATIAVNAWHVAAWYLPVAHSPVADSDIRILHANILVSNDSSDRFFMAVTKADPDIVVMQEATPEWLSSLGSLDSIYPYKLVESRNDPFGIALYSKYPFESSVVNAAEPFGFPQIIATAVIDEKRLHILSAHPANPVGASNASGRNLQLDGLAELAARTPSPLVVIGDLNITMWAHHYRLFEDKSGLRNARLGFGIKPTWPLFLPFAMIPIDQCLVSDDIEVTDFTTGPNIGSDHLPIVVTLRLH